MSAYIHRIKLVNNLTNGIHNDNFKNALKEAKLVDDLIAMYNAAEIAYVFNYARFEENPFDHSACQNQTLLWRALHQQSQPQNQRLRHSLLQPLSDGKPA